jgi:hypothetical protein
MKASLSCRTIVIPRSRFLPLTIMPFVPHAAKAHVRAKESAIEEPRHIPEWLSHPQKTRDHRGSEKKHRPLEAYRQPYARDRGSIGQHQPGNNGGYKENGRDL